MKIIKVVDDEEKKKITRAILEALPEWFGIIEAREKYILDSVGKDFFCAIEKDKVVGFLYLKQTGKDTVELAVMGVLKEYHRKGIGIRKGKYKGKWIFVYPGKNSEDGNV